MAFLFATGFVFGATAPLRLAPREGSARAVEGAFALLGCLALRLLILAFERLEETAGPSTGGNKLI